MKGSETNTGDQSSISPKNAKIPLISTPSAAQIRGEMREQDKHQEIQERQALLSRLEKIDTEQPSRNKDRIKSHGCYGDVSEIIASKASL